jgi:hypothetical protein
MFCACVIIAQRFCKWKKKKSGKRGKTADFTNIGKLWIMWISRGEPHQIKHCLGKKIHMERRIKINIAMWIMWITYSPRMFSPISTTFPAPIVINRSSCTHFFNKNFSISSKDGK